MTRLELKSSLEHLPRRKQRELARIVDILHKGFDDRLKLATSAQIKRGRILKIILFGSHARDNWVEDRRSGYVSDYDLLVVVNAERFADFATYWYDTEDRLLRASDIEPEVNFIVHSKAFVNASLVEGRYFFADIVGEGIELYGLKGHFLKKPIPLDEDAARELAKEYFEEWYPSAIEFYTMYQFALSKGWTKKAAFLLHQATENLYQCFLLVRTQYAPAIHNIKRLRALAEDIDRDLVAAWPRDTRQARRRFELLKEAYVKARYAKHYRITREELQWLGERAKALAALVKQTCKAHLQ